VQLAEEVPWDGDGVTTAAGTESMHVALDDELADGAIVSCDTTEPNIAPPTDPTIPPTPVNAIGTGVPTTCVVTVTKALLVAALCGVSETPNVRMIPAVSHRNGDPVVQAAVTEPGGLIQYETSRELLHDQVPAL
jgi:hypothetical protein